MARAAPKSKKRPAPKSKKEVKSKVENETDEEKYDNEREADDSSAEEANNNDDVKEEQVNEEEEEEEPPAKKGRPGRKPKGGKKAPVKKPAKGSRAQSNRKSASKKDEEDETEYEVEKVVGVRFKNRVKQYEIKWKRYPSGQNTWEPEDNLNCDDAIRAFEEAQEEAKKNPPRVVRDNPKSTERYADIVMPSGGKRHSGRMAKSPRKTYREDPDDY